MIQNINLKANLLNIKTIKFQLMKLQMFSIDREQFNKSQNIFHFRV